MPGPGYTINVSLPAQLNELLRQVSRSFYLTMRVLPRPVRAPIGLAYLLARTSDTIADTPLIPAGERIRALDEFRRSICSGTGLAGFGRFALSTHVEETDQRLGIERLNPERALLIRCAEFVEALAMLPEPERNLVREVLDTIISGQKLDLQKFAEASVEHVIALESDRELDDYTYRVAGCVGSFWTRLCVARLLGGARCNTSRLIDLGVNFGKGLQLVNILRDIGSDLGNGRCYIPRNRLSEVGLQPRSLLKPETMHVFRPLYNQYLDRAIELLGDGWSYTNMLPKNQVRLRLACAWPILIGARTIALLRNSNVLDPANKIKITRSEVHQLIAASICCYPLGVFWNKLFHNAQS